MLREVLGMAGLLLTSCSSVYVQANLQGYGLEGADLDSFRAFRASPPSGDDALRDQALGRLVAAELTARGLENRGAGDAAGAQEFAFSFDLTMDERTVIVPEQVHVTESYRPGHSWRVQGGAGGQWVTVHTPGEWYPQTWISGGYTVREYTHALVLRFRDATGREIWRGDLRTVGASGDLMAVMRACLPALLGEFPAPSGLPAERRIRVDRPAE